MDKIKNLFKNIVLVLKQIKCKHKNYETIFQDHRYRDVRIDKCFDCQLEFYPGTPSETSRLFHHMATGKLKDPSPKDIDKMPPSRLSF